MARGISRLPKKMVRNHNLTTTQLELLKNYGGRPQDVSHDHAGMNKMFQAAVYLRREDHHVYRENMKKRYEEHKKTSS